MGWGCVVGGLEMWLGGVCLWLGWGVGAVGLVCVSVSFLLP